MKQSKAISSLLLITLFLLLAGCAAQPQSTPTAMALVETSLPVETFKPVDTTSAVVENPSVAPTLDVEALILEKVAGNHDVERIYGASKTREEWNATLDRMIGYGAKISSAEKEIIIEYLLSRQ